MAIDFDGTLDTSNAFERVLFNMAELQRRKAQDYAADGDILKNMREVVAALGIKDYTVIEDCNAMVIRKTARISNLRGRSASNEPLYDSYLDRAVYAVLAVVALEENTEIADG
jgi:hydroxymethylpyrimidine pyrophosphatase-like HAD family hydrolase